MGNNVQIPRDLWHLLVRWHLLGVQEPADLQRIEEMMASKLDALIRHQLYTESKTDPDPQARERARKKYLDEIGMHEDWRY